MSDTTWKPESHENCGELGVQQWKSTVTGNFPNPSKKMTVLGLQRSFQNDQSLLKLTEELQHRREKLATTLTEEVTREIYQLNKSTLGEIKLLTSRLLEFLRDVQINVEKSTCYDEIIPHWKNEWDSNIQEWNCDVHSLLRKLQGNIKIALVKGESSFMESKKFTPAQVESFLNDQVIKINQLMIVNEKMYTDTERHLKLMFDSLLQNWLISYSFQECFTDTAEHPEFEHQTSLDETELLQETFKVADQIVTGLDEDEPQFSQISSLKIYLSHLRMCQEHVKLHLREALRYLKNHLSQQGGRFMENESKIRLEELWRDIVNIFKEQCDEFKNYCKQSAYAWNKFIKRLHCAETNALNSINKFRTAKLVHALVSEQHINLLLDQLRESSNLMSMEQIYDRIVIEIENAELKCVSFRNEENEIIRQLATACFAAYDIFSLQMTLLNESHPNAETDVFCVERDLDETKEITDSEFISMKFCVFSAQTWLQGLKETILLLEGELPQFLKTFLINLTNSYKGESEYWLMLQLEKLSKRKLRIRKDVLEIRISELNAHDVAQKTLFHAIELNEKKTKVCLKKIKEELTRSDGALIVHLNETKTNKLEDTAEKKIKNLKNEGTLEKHEMVRKQKIRKTKYELERTFKWLADTCSTYLLSLRLFHEGGNYSSEECESTFKKIGKAVKELASLCDKTLKKLDNVYSTTREMFKKKLAKIVYPDPTEDELLKAAEGEANNRLEICFNRLKEMLKNETYKALHNLDAFRESINEAKTDNDFQSWHLFITTMEQSCNYFGLSSAFSMLELSRVLAIAKKLAFPSYTQRISAVSAYTGLSQDGSGLGSGKLRKSASVKLSKKKKCRTVSHTTIKSDASESLFCSSVVFNEEDNYLSNVKTLISDTFTGIKPILTDAYSKYNVSKDHSALLKTRASATLRHYNLQCESVWTFLFLEYLNVMYSAYTNVLSFIELMKNRFIYESANESMKLKNDHKTQLSQLNVEGVKESIENKLKPWHGYPLNKPLLQELLKDVVEHCKGQLLSRKQVNETYRDELKALIAANKLKATVISEDAKFLFIELFTNVIINPFLENIVNYIANKEFGESNLDLGWIKKGIRDYCTKPPKEIFKAVYDEIEFTSLNGYEFWNFMPNMRQITSILKKFQEVLELPPALQEDTKKSFFDFKKGETVEEEEEMLPIWIKLEEEIRTYLQDFENKAVKSLVQAKRDFDRVSWDLTRWKSEWISNIKEVNRLYMINPILDPPPKKLVSDAGAALRLEKTEEVTEQVD